MTKRNRYFLVIFTFFLCIVQPLNSYTQNEIICYKLTKTVYENKKVEDKSKTNSFRYYKFMDNPSDPDDKLLILTDAQGTPIFNTIASQRGLKETIKTKLHIIDSPDREIQTFEFKERTKAGVIIYESVMGWKNTYISIRVSSDRSVINIYYRKNKLTNEYITDVWERVKSPNADINIIH